MADPPTVPGGATPLTVQWQALLDAYQGFVAEDPDLRPLLRLDSGEVTCWALLGDDPAQTLELPAKGAGRSLDQRREFAESLCEAELRAAVLASLEGADPFRAFDKALQPVPIEAARWNEEERLRDVEALYAWLRRAGIDAEPAPTLGRHIIEFPMRRETP